MARISYWKGGSDGPALTLGMKQVTPDDDNDLPGDEGFGMTVRTAGDVKWTDGAGNTHTETFAANEGIATNIVRIFATGTTSTKIWVGVM